MPDEDIDGVNSTPHRHLYVIVLTTAIHKSVINLVISQLRSFPISNGLVSGIEQLKVWTLTRRVFPARVSPSSIIHTHETAYPSLPTLTRLTCTCCHGETQSTIVTVAINSIRQRRDRRCSHAQRSSKDAEDVP